MSKPEPGALHPVDQAFYDLTVKQRDAAWREVERLKEEIAAAKRALDFYAPEWRTAEPTENRLHP